MTLLKPLVSIVIPSYQSAQFVTKAIDSCLSQTYQNIEIIVIDDGSTDDTKEILSSYIKSQEICYTFQENKGLSGARNTGLKIARGEYIQFLDADDTITPNKVKLQIEYLQKNKLYIGVYSDYVVQKKNQLIHYKKNYPVGNLFNYVAYSNFIMPIHTVLLMKQNIPFFDESLTQGEDRDFWLNIFTNKSNQFGFIDQPLAIYYIHATNMTRNSEENLLSVIHILNNHMQFCTLYQRNILKEAIYYHFGLLGINSMEESFFKKARYYFLKSFSIKSFKYKFIFIGAYLLSFIPLLYIFFKKIFLYIRKNITHPRKVQIESR